MKKYVDLKLEPNTYYNYESTIRNHISPHLGKYKVKSLTPHVLQQFINLKTREGYARQTLSIIIGILSKALNHAVYPYKYIKENRLKYGEFYQKDSEHDYVCKKENGEHCTPSVIKYNTRKISEKLNISFNYHSLRHTHATTLIENGTVQKRLGHSRATVTEERYVHLTEKMARDAANIFDSFAQDI